MSEKEFYEWLETCPTHEWEINHSQEGEGCMVIFRWLPEEDKNS